MQKAACSPPICLFVGAIADIWIQVILCDLNVKVFDWNIWETCLLWYAGLAIPLICDKPAVRKYSLVVLNVQTSLLIESIG